MDKCHICGNKNLLVLKFPRNFKFIFSNSKPSQEHKVIGYCNSCNLSVTVISEKFKKEMNFDDATISEIDGIRVSYENSWGLLRASNTSPKLVLRFEGKNMNEMEFIKSKFEENLKRIFPEINLNYH